MSETCCIPNCRSNANNHTKQYVVSFYFPKNEEMKREWLKQVPIANFVPSTHSKVCIEHFSENDLIRHTLEIDSDGEQYTRPIKKVRLAPGAVPTIFKCPKKSKSDTRSDATLTSPNPQRMFDTCRICLTEEKRTELIPLFEDAQSELLFQIRNVSGVTFEKADDIPNGICKKCVADLHTAHSFRLLCINAEKHFENEDYYAHQIDAADVNQVRETFSEYGEIKCEGFLEEETATEDDWLTTENGSEVDESKIKVLSSLAARPAKIRRKKKMQTLVCELCGNKFDKTHYFKIHMQQHNEDKQFECDAKEQAKFVTNFMENGKEVAETDQKRVRSKTRCWTRLMDFEEASEAEMYVRNEGLWSKASFKRNMDGERVDFRCNKGLYRENECPAAIYLQYHSGEKRVSLYSTNSEHVHNIATKSGHRMTGECKEMISNLFKMGINKPNAILAAFRSNNLVEPSKTQLINFLRTLRRQMRNPLNISSKELHT